MVQRGNVMLTSYFIIHQVGTTFDGTIVINGAVDLPFLNPRVEGNEAVFTTTWNRDYRLRADKDKLHVTLAYSHGGKDEGFAVRVPEAETKPPKFIPLPSLSPVPVNGLAQTPPMGWNSWNHFGSNVDDSIVRAAADKLVSSGLSSLGYVYINIDDCWEGTRDPNGNIVPNGKFPDMKALADYVHERGLKLGWEVTGMKSRMQKPTHPGASITLNMTGAVLPEFIPISSCKPLFRKWELPW